jgi:hypothetical protein
LEHHIQHIRGWRFQAAYFGVLEIDGALRRQFLNAVSQENVLGQEFV